MAPSSHGDLERNVELSPTGSQTFPVLLAYSITKVFKHSHVFNGCSSIAGCVHSWYSPLLVEHQGHQKHPERSTTHRKQGSFREAVLMLSECGEKTVLGNKMQAKGFFLLLESHLVAVKQK